MDTAPHPVTYQTVLELIGPHGPHSYEAELGYDSRDPFAVTLRIPMTGMRVTWVFGRELLMRGMSEPIGEGDVFVSPSLDSGGSAAVVLILRSPPHQAVLQVPTWDVFQFLARTMREVWPGTESRHVQTDAAIAAILMADGTPP